MLASQSSYRRTIWGGLVALAAAVALLVAAPGASAAYTCGTTLDDFDRADSTNVGSKWTERAPDFAIAGQRATNPGATAGLMTFNNLAATEVCVDIAANGTGVQYGGVALRYGSLTQNLFVKVQQNAGAGFDRAYFYVGNNGAGTPTPSSVPLAAFAGARLHVFVVGNRVTLDIDTNFDGTPEQSFGSDYPAGAGTGTEVALVSYGGARLDNFREPAPASNPVPTAPQPGTGTPTPDSTAGKPRLGALSLSNSVFEAARSGPTVGAAAVGTTVRFSLSEDSSVRFTVQRKARGRRVGGRCVRPRRSNRTRRSCTRWVSVRGAFTVKAKAGVNSFKYNGRLAGRSLKPASYRFSARATDSDRNRSVLRRKRFRIVD